MGKRKDPVGEDSPGKQKKKKSNAVDAADAMEVGFKKKKKKKEKKPKDDCEIKDRVEENAAAKGTEEGDVADKDAEPNIKEKRAKELRSVLLNLAEGKEEELEGFEIMLQELSKKQRTQKALFLGNYSGFGPIDDLHKRIIEPFDGLSAEAALDRLSDPTVSMKLALPSTLGSENSPPTTFTFVGRKTFPRLLRQVKAGGRTNFRGHSGRGKSYLLAALACYLHTYEDQCGIVVYLLMSELIDNFEYLLDALLLAYARYPSKQYQVLASSTSEEELLDFCRLAKPVCLLDEMNELDNDKETAGSTAETRGAARLWQNRFYVAGVSCASDNSTFQPANKKGFSHLFLLNQPFDMLELCGWISSGNHFEQDDFHELLLYTGFIPGHLHDYAKNKSGFIEQMQDQMDLFINKMGKKEEDAVWEVLRGKMHMLSGSLDPDLFYERPLGDGVTVLPFLEPKLRAVMEMKLKFGEPIFS